MSGSKRDWYSRLIRDPEVPIYLKVVPFVGLLYVIMPIDLITDFAPVIGQLDDITALIVGAKVFIELAPPPNRGPPSARDSPTRWV
ncbi:MAG: DUF1232 domain-containing protein [Chloroflexi bacterium]|nr:DUF1232 domain-containing protein [Chloroflexota bacterium]